MKPSVSIILPTYNRADCLSRSIGSVLNQTFCNFELIIVDDASTDSSKEVIATFDDQRIIHLEHERNLGGSVARNTGIRAAQGEFIAFQDSDDIWLPEKLAKQMAVFEDSPASLGVVYTQCSRWEDDRLHEIPNDLPKLKNGNLYHALLPGNFIVLPSVVVKKECLEKAGNFDESLPRLQDWELFLRLAKFYEFRYVPEPLVHSFFTEGSISSKPIALRKAFEIILKKNLAEYKTDQGLYANQLLNLSGLYRLENDLKNSRKYLIEAYKVNYRPGLMVAIMASYFGIGFFSFYWKLMNKVQG